MSVDVLQVSEQISHPFVFVIVDGVGILLDLEISEFIFEHGVFDVACLDQIK